MTVSGILDDLLFFYFIILLGRLVFDWVQVFARDWTPTGIVLVIAEVIYTLTDPPLKALRRVIPPLRIGGVALDLGFLVLIFGVTFARVFVGLIPF